MSRSTMETGEEEIEEPEDIKVTTGATREATEATPPTGWDEEMFEITKNFDQLNVNFPSCFMHVGYT